MHVPIVIDNTLRSGSSYDIFSRLLRDRIIFVSGEFNDCMANIVVAQLLFLESEDSKKDIYMYINSPGGVISSGLAIYDTMQYINANISTLCIGQACSMAATILISGAKGMRYALPHSRIMIHQPMSSYKGQATDIQIHANEVMKVKSLINNIYAKHTNNNLDYITNIMERDFFMSPQEALDLGIVDKIIV